MKEIKHTALVMAAMAAIAGGCVAFNVGKPEHYRLDCGKDGSILVTRQKRMSIGFCPAQAEETQRPPESVMPMVGWDHWGNGKFSRDQREEVARYVVYGLFATPWAILVAPWLDDYYCDHHYWLYGNVELLSKFPKDVRDKIHVKTWHDNDRNIGGFTSPGHSALLGVHKYATVVIEKLDEGEEKSSYENQ